MTRGSLRTLGVASVDRRTVPTGVRSFAQIRVSTPRRRTRTCKLFASRCGAVVLALAAVPVTIDDALALLRLTRAYLRGELISSVF